MHDTSPTWIPSDEAPTAAVALAGAGAPAAATGSSGTAALRNVAAALLRLVVLVVVLVGAGLGADASLTALGVPALPTDLLTAGALLAVYGVLVRLVEHRRATELAERRAGPELALGVALGAGLFTVTIASLGALGAYHVDGTNGLGVLGTSLGVAVLAAVSEELLLRAVLFRVLERRLGTWPALGISSAVFGALHLPNPGATVTGALAVAVEAGLLLGLAYVVTRRLWLPIGLHLAWDFTESGIFGTSDSGHVVQGLFRSHLTGPPLLSGGALGPESSIVAVLTRSVPVGTLLVRARHRRLLPTSWRRARDMSGRR